MHTYFNVSSSWDCFPSVSALKFDSTLTLGVGTATGQILLYDIRSNKPFCIKDHLYGLPIKDIDFHYQGELVYSMDSSVLKIWDKNNVSGRFVKSVNWKSGYRLKTVFTITIDRFKHIFRFDGCYSKA